MRWHAETSTVLSWLRIVMKAAEVVVSSSYTRNDGPSEYIAPQKSRLLRFFYHSYIRPSASKRRSSLPTGTTYFIVLSLSLSLSHHALPFSIAFGLGIFPLTPPFPSTSLAVICTPRSALTLIVTSTFPPFFTATMAASASTVPTFQAFSRISSSCVGFLGLVRVLIA